MMRVAICLRLQYSQQVTKTITDIELFAHLVSLLNETALTNEAYEKQTAPILISEHDGKHSYCLLTAKCILHNTLPTNQDQSNLRMST